MNFWRKLDKPIVGMAPMDGVTDASFRHIVCEYGKPDVVFTEFTNVEGLARGAVIMLQAFIYEEKERPIVAQVFGVEKKSFYKAAVMLCAMGFDGIDVNMGCPMKKVAVKGSGAGLIQTPELACEIIGECKRGVEDWVNGASLEEAGVHEDIVGAIEDGDSRPPACRQTGNDRCRVPVSVKTRIGYEKDIGVEWVGRLVEAKPDAIIMHGRTLRQMYTGEASWEGITRAGEVARNSGIVFLGNGDVKSLDDAYMKSEKYKVDGVLVGRAVMGNPWFFDEKYKDGDFSKITKNERLKVLLEHSKYYSENSPNLPFHNIKKHLAWYCKGFSGAREMRMRLMGTTCIEEVIKELGIKFK